MTTQIHFKEQNATKAKVGELEYGTVLTGVSSNPKCIYVKVNKYKLGNNINLGIPGGHSLLYNIKHGSLRAIRGDIEVTILDADIALQESNCIFENLKEYYQNRFNTTQKEDC